MIEIQSDRFEAVGVAIREALKTCATVDGKKLHFANKEYGSDEVESAARIALMSLTQSYVRPKGTISFLGSERLIRRNFKYG